MRYLLILLLFLFLGCSQIFKDDTPPIVDSDNDGYDDRDITFLQKLIDNSQDYDIPPAPDLDPTELGEQIWVEGRLRSLKHGGGVGGFWLYGEIPEEIKDVQYLNKLHLEDNQFTSIAEEISELTNLSEIILNNNRFYGEVPEGLWKNKSNLKNLSIFNNYFSSIPESICDDYDGISHIVISHNNLCNIPSCISNSGIQSCDCYGYITMDICLEMNSDISCGKTIGEVVESCPLNQFWGQSVFDYLSNLDPNACVDWEGTCDSTFIESIDDQTIGFGIDLTNGCIDCNGNPCDEKLSWIGDGICDEGENLNFSCIEFNCDMEDCGFYIETESTCYCQRDCFGQCIDNLSCGNEYWAAYGYDCCIDDGTCEDVSGDGVITSWMGDGWCDDGTWGYGFDCEEVDGFEFNCDDGDCGVWNPETEQCEPPGGQILNSNQNFIKNFPISREE